MSVDPRSPGPDSDRFFFHKGKRVFIHRTSPFEVATQSFGLRSFASKMPAWIRGLDLTDRQLRRLFKHRGKLKFLPAAIPINANAKTKKVRSKSTKNRNSKFQKGTKQRTSKCRCGSSNSLHNVCRCGQRSSRTNNRHRRRRSDRFSHNGI